MTLQLFLIIALLILASIVSYGMWKKKVMWAWTAIYWTVLAVKIVADIVSEVE